MKHEANTRSLRAMMMMMTTMMMATTTWNGDNNLIRNQWLKALPSSCSFAFSPENAYTFRFNACIRVKSILALHRLVCNVSVDGRGHKEKLCVLTFLLFCCIFGNNRRKKRAHDSNKERNNSQQPHECERILVLWTHVHRIALLIWYFVSFEN